jgi:hypothetical protein
MTGKDVKKYFNGCYETFGRHHSQTSSYRIDLTKYRRNIKDEALYRLFINEFFCKIMNGETDAPVCFFGYTKNKPTWAKD